MIADNKWVSFSSKSHDLKNLVVYFKSTKIISHCKLEEFYKKDVLKNCCQIFIKLLVLGSLFNKKCKVEYQADICLNKYRLIYKVQEMVSKQKGTINNFQWSIITELHHNKFPSNTWNSFLSGISFQGIYSCLKLYFL